MHKNNRSRFKCWLFVSMPVSTILYEKIGKRQQKTRRACTAKLDDKRAKVVQAAEERRNRNLLEDLRWTGDIHCCYHKLYRPVFVRCVPIEDTCFGLESCGHRSLIFYVSSSKQTCSSAVFKNGATANWCSWTMDILYKKKRTEFEHDYACKYNGPRCDGKMDQRL